MHASQSPQGHAAPAQGHAAPAQGVGGQANPRTQGAFEKQAGKTGKGGGGVKARGNNKETAGPEE